MAAGTSPQEFRGLTDEELVTRLRESKEELFNLRFQGATGQLDAALVITTEAPQHLRQHQQRRQRG